MTIPDSITIPLWWLKSPAVAWPGGAAIGAVLRDPKGSGILFAKGLRKIPPVRWFLDTYRPQINEFTDAFQGENNADSTEDVPVAPAAPPAGPVEQG